ncbi:Glycosyltransferase 2-like domain-containing protein [uncultured Gammaproteobacteria bacterium]
MTGGGVSFLVPVYNKVPWLPRVLAAIRNQRGDFPRQYVFVDDGSTDGSLELVREMTAGWDNVIIHAQENHGSAHATNQCIALATLPLIKFVDADDLIARDATVALRAALAAQPDACIAWGDVERYPPESVPDLEQPIIAPRLSRLEQPIIPTLRNSMFNPTQFMTRTEAVRAVGGCDERIVHSQEYSLTLRLATRGPFVHVEAPMAFLPRHVPGSLGTNVPRQLQRVTRTCANFLRDYPHLPASVRHYACRRCAGRAWRFARRNGFGGLDSPWFRLYLRGLLPGTRDAEFIDACARVFD